MGDFTCGKHKLLVSAAATMNKAAQQGPQDDDLETVLADGDVELELPDAYAWRRPRLRRELLWQVSLRAMSHHLSIQSQACSPRYTLLHAGARTGMAGDVSAENT